MSKGPLAAASNADLQSSPAEPFVLGLGVVLSAIRVIQEFQGH
jgi:hypothetical protein